MSFVRKGFVLATIVVALGFGAAAGPAAAQGDAGGEVAEDAAGADEAGVIAAVFGGLVLVGIVGAAVMGRGAPLPGEELAFDDDDGVDDEYVGHLDEDVVDEDVSTSWGEEPLDEEDPVWADTDTEVDVEEALDDDALADLLGGSVEDDGDAQLESFDAGDEVDEVEEELLEIALEEELALDEDLADEDVADEPEPEPEPVPEPEPEPEPDADPSAEQRSELTEQLDAAEMAELEAADARELKAEVLVGAEREQADAEEAYAASEQALADAIAAASAARDAAVDQITSLEDVSMSDESREALADYGRGMLSGGELRRRWIAAGDEDAVERVRRHGQRARGEGDEGTPDVAAAEAAEQDATRDADAARRRVEEAASALESAQREAEQAAADEADAAAEVARVRAELDALD